MRNDEPSSPDDAEVSAPRPGIGETLRATREFRRASIEYVAELLRIEPRFLAALEEERFDAIGPPVFVKGYLKHYCELLGIDARPLLDELRERLAGEDPPLRARRSAEQEQEQERPGLAAIGVAAAVIVLGAVAIWRFGGFGGGPAESEISTVAPRSVSAAEPEVVAAPQTPAAEGRAAEESRGAVVETEIGAVEPELPAIAPEVTAVEASAERAEARPPATDQAVSSDIPAPAGGAATTAGSVRPPAADVSVAAAEPAPATAPPGQTEASPDSGAGLEIELRFVADSWTEVTAAGGERLFYGLARAGSEERIRAEGEVRVLLGNADGVVVRVNGEPFAYPAGSRNGDLARFRLSPEN